MLPKTRHCWCWGQTCNKVKVFSLVSQFLLVLLRFFEKRLEQRTNSFPYLTLITPTHQSVSSNTKQKKRKQNVRSCLCWPYIVGCLDMWKSGSKEDYTRNYTLKRNWLLPTELLSTAFTSGGSSVLTSPLHTGILMVWGCLVLG